MPEGGSDRRRVGILGGTFDPPHLGHLLIAETARVALDLERVMFLPAGEPWLKSGQRITPAHHRLKMVQLAVADNPGFCVSDCEIRRTGATYTVDTLREVRRNVPADTELYFIVGRTSWTSSTAGRNRRPSWNCAASRSSNGPAAPRKGIAALRERLCGRAGRRRGGVRSRPAGRLQRIGVAARAGGRPIYPLPDPGRCGGIHSWARVVSGIVRSRIFWIGGLIGLGSACRGTVPILVIIRIR